MHLDITDRTIFACLQISYDAGFTERMETLNDRRGIYEVSATEHTHQMGVELGNFNPGCPMHGDGRRGLLSVSFSLGWRLLLGGPGTMRCPGGRSADEQQPRGGHLELICRRCQCRDCVHPPLLQPKPNRGWEVPRYLPGFLRSATVQALPPPVAGSGQITPCSALCPDRLLMCTVLPLLPVHSPAPQLSLLP